VAANNLISARLSVFNNCPRKPALPSVMPHPSPLGSFSRSRATPSKWEFLARLPHQSPAAVTGDAFTFPVGLGCPVDFRAGRDDESAIVVDVVGDQRDNRRLNRRRVNGHDEFAGNQAAIRRVELTQWLELRLGRKRFCIETDCVKRR